MKCLGIKYKANTPKGIGFAKKGYPAVILRRQRLGSTHPKALRW